jgi:phospholipid/cholesterol/gamma-HCH transport system substrate-binding protein
VRRSWAAVTVGLLAIVITVSAIALFRYTSEGIGSADSYKVHAYFRDAVGIVQKSPVRTAGLDIGRIFTKELSPDARAKITIEIDATIPLYENAMISKKAESLLGQFYLEIDPGTEYALGPEGQKVKQRRLGDGDQITRVFESPSVSTILDQVNSTMPILRDILRDVRDLTSGQMREIATGVNDMVQKNSVVLERLLLRVDNIAAQVEAIAQSESDDIRVSLRNVREITEGLKHLVGTSEGQVTATGTEMRSSLQKLQNSVDTLDRSLQNVEKVTSRLEKGEGTAGRLLADDTIARNVEEITEDAGGFIRGITRIQTMVGLRTEYNYLAGTFKNYFQVQLQPRPDKFYLLEIIDDPRGYREASTTVTDSSERGLVTERTIKTSEKLRFSLQFGKRIGFFTGRFGIKESTGGVGADFSFLDDRLTLSLDFFDTHSNENPRVQARTTFAVYKDNLHLVAGADDLLNYEPATGSGGAFFDWFFGLKLVFKEEDLKSMLLFGGGAFGAAAGR